MTKIVVTVAKFTTHCVDFLHLVETKGVSIELTRDGVPVAKLVGRTIGNHGAEPWKRLRGKGRLSGTPETSVLTELS